MTRALWIVFMLAAGSAARSEEGFARKQMDARFHYDLGPAELDVSSYPKAQQAGYATFQQACSRCHTLARPINSPLAHRRDWRRYVKRMHLHSKAWKGAPLTRKDAETVVDFLVYDSERRKLQNRATFEAKDRELRDLFDRVRRERSRSRLEQDKANARQDVGPAAVHPRER